MRSFARLPIRGLLTLVVGAGLFAMSAGCADSGPYTWAREVPLATPASVPGEPVIQPRDTLLVLVTNQKDISGEFPVREDGRYVQPPLGIVQAAGHTPGQLAAELRQRMQTMIVNPEIAVTISKRAPIRVNVIGEVKTPASYELERDRSVIAALAAAGWLTEYASTDRIYVVRARETPGRIRFRSQDLRRAEPHSALFQLHDGDVLVVE